MKHAKHISILFFLLLTIFSCNNKSGNSKITFAISDIYQGDNSITSYKLIIQNNTKYPLPIYLPNYQISSDSLTSLLLMSKGSSFSEEKRTFYFCAKNKYPIYLHFFPVDNYGDTVKEIKIIPRKTIILPCISLKYDDSIFKMKCYMIVGKDSFEVKLQNTKIHSRAAYIFDFIDSTQQPELFKKEGIFVNRLADSIYLINRVR